VTDDAEALARGMQDKAAEFRAAGSDIYLPASAESERKAAT